MTDYNHPSVTPVMTVQATYVDTGRLQPRRFELEDEMQYTVKQRQRLSAEAYGKRVVSLEWDDDGGYWVMIFDDDTEISFRLMAELV